MTKAEFKEHVNRLLSPNDQVNAITDEEYKIVETVYGFHPSISDVNGKEQIARLYVDFGFIVIVDMYLRAKAAETLYIKRRNLVAKHNAELSRLSEQESLVSTAGISQLNEIICES